MSCKSEEHWWCGEESKWGMDHIAKHLILRPTTMNFTAAGKTEEIWDQIDNLGTTKCMHQLFQSSQCPTWKSHADSRENADWQFCCIGLLAL